LMWNIFTNKDFNDPGKEHNQNYSLTSNSTSCKELGSSTGAIKREGITVGQVVG